MREDESVNRVLNRWLIRALQTSFFFSFHVLIFRLRLYRNVEWDEGRGCRKEYEPAVILYAYNVYGVIKRDGNNFKSTEIFGRWGGWSGGNFTATSSKLVKKSRWHKTPPYWTQFTAATHKHHPIAAPSRSLTKSNLAYLTDQEAISTDTFPLGVFVFDVNSFSTWNTNLGVTLMLRMVQS